MSVWLQQRYFDDVHTRISYPRIMLFHSMSLFEYSIHQYMLSNSRCITLRQGMAVLFLPFRYHICVSWLIELRHQQNGHLQTPFSKAFSIWYTLNFEKKSLFGSWVHFASYHFTDAYTRHPASVCNHMRCSGATGRLGYVARRWGTGIIHVDLEHVFPWAEMAAILK